MMPLKNSKAKDYCFDYGYVYMNIYDIAEKFYMFPCDEMQDVLYLFKTLFFAYLVSFIARGKTI